MPLSSLDFRASAAMWSIPRISYWSRTDAQSGGRISLALAFSIESSSPFRLSNLILFETITIFFYWKKRRSTQSVLWKFSKTGHPCFTCSGRRRIRPSERNNEPQITRIRTDDQVRDGKCRIQECERFILGIYGMIFNSSRLDCMRTEERLFMWCMCRV